MLKTIVPNSDKSLQTTRDNLGKDINVCKQEGDTVLRLEQAKQFFKKKNKLKMAVFENVKKIFKESGDFASSGFFVDSGDNLLGAKKIEALSEVDEYLFCDNIFRKIYIDCFGHLNNREDVFRHIMARVLNGGSINQERDEEFIYDNLDKKAEKLLCELKSVDNLDDLRKKIGVGEHSVKSGITWQ